MGSATICVDIDNVVAKTDDVMRSVIRSTSRTGVDLAYEDVVRFDYWLCRDSLGRRMDRGEWSAIHKEFTRNHLHRIAPMPDVQQHLQDLRGKFAVHLVTSRLIEGKGATVDWLTQHQIPYDELVFVEHGAKHLLQTDFAVAVEDDWEQAFLLQNSGVQVILMAHPWNDRGPHSPLKRVCDWAGVARAVRLFGGT